MPEILSKTESDGDFFVTVRQSLVLNGQNVNRLALRLRNDAPFTATGVRLRVVRTDVTGSKREEREFDVDGILIRPAQESILPDIALPIAWKSVDVRIVSVRSDEYVYALSEDGDRIVMQRETRRERVRSFSHGKGSVSRKYGRRGALAVILGIVAITAIILGAVLPSVIENGREKIMQHAASRGEYVEVQEHS